MTREREKTTLTSLWWWWTRGTGKLCGLSGKKKRL